MRAVCTILLKRAHPYKGSWMTLGGMLNAPSNSKVGAMVLLCQRLFGLEGQTAAARAAHIIDLAADPSHGPSPCIEGPFGDGNAPHNAFILRKVLGDIDALETSFTPNRWASEAILIPIDLIDGSKPQIELGRGNSEPIKLKNKVGHLRMLRARSLAIEIQDALQADDVPIRALRSTSASVLPI